jgi:hypothetical protein
MGRTGVDIERITQRLELRRQQILEFLRRLDVEAQELDADSVQDIADAQCPQHVEGIII